MVSLARANHSDLIGRLPRLFPAGNDLGVQDEKRVKGIEPSPKAWEAFVLPLNYTREAGRKLSTVDARVKL